MYMIFFNKSHIHLENGIFKYVFREEKGDSSPANREKDVTKDNESS
jgi:hypothetical protein